MKQQNKETVFLLAVTTVLAIAISRAYAAPETSNFLPVVQASQSQPK